MIDIRWHARGGQGAKTAAAMVAAVAIEGGRYAQGFPEYGAERAGAPTRAYNRVRETPIREHDAVYRPDIVLVLDASLLDSQGVTDGLGEDGALLVNTGETPGAVRERTGWQDGRVFTVDASALAREEVGRPIPNTAMIGALVAVSGVVPMDRVRAALEKKLSTKLGEDEVEGNLRALERAARKIQGEDNG